MRRLLLIRHAKSSWNHPGLSDHDRPLNKRGEKDAPLMAKRLAKRDEKIDTIFTSTAVRANAMATALTEALHAPIVEKRKLYTFSEQELFKQLLNLPENDFAVAVVGHNPAITGVVNFLLGFVTDNVPTAGVVAINCDINDWTELAPSDCRIDYFDYPKNKDH